ncbi:hypothetical protein EI94DRAFT_1708181 [Lactarius quietus]|nr:hypothetical protein EI94DRAFT_1708181 [Lactarius quietus]
MSLHVISYDIRPKSETWQKELSKPADISKMLLARYLRCSPKGPSAGNGWNASIQVPHPDYLGALDSEDDYGLDTHSFDEEEMYGFDNADDIIASCLDSVEDADLSLDDLVIRCLDSASDVQMSLIGIFDDVIQEMKALHTDISAMATGYRAL